MPGDVFDINVVRAGVERFYVSDRALRTAIVRADTVGRVLSVAA